MTSPRSASGNTISARVWNSDQPQLLLDEMEEKMNAWSSWYNRCIRIKIGLNFGHTTVDRRPDLDLYELTAKAMYDVVCSNFVSNDLFHQLLTSEPDVTQEELLIKQKAGFWTEQVIVPNNGMIANDTPAAPIELKKFIIGVLPQMSPNLNDKRMQRKTYDLLRAQMEHYVLNQKIAAVLLEANQISDGMSFIIHCMLQLVRIWHHKSRCTLVVQMNLGQDSNQVLHWFKGIRRSANRETRRLQPALRLCKEVPDDTDITAWNKERVAFVSVSTDIFKNIENPNAVELSPRHKAVLLKFMDHKAQVLIEPQEKCLELKKYSNYIYAMWKAHLKARRPVFSTPTPRLVSASANNSTEC